MVDFGEKGKPIALLFDENWAPPKIADFGEKGRARPCFLVEKGWI